MIGTLKAAFEDRSLSLDRSDIFENTRQVYPKSYQNFQNAIENTFFKSELLLKCKLEFERLITIDLPDSITNSESLNKDLNLTLLFTGAIKSGRSSLINMLLNTKVMPTNIIGSSCCVTITHPKSGTKQITVGVHDLDGWEIDKYLDLEISDLPGKIESLQYMVGKKSCERNQQFNRRIHVQLPHWLLKNINIYECPAIDGIFSFDEPFDIITKTEHIILIYVIDAKNGLMQWDRTFLAKIQLNWPHLPIFFVINHVDIQPEIIARDQGPRFESITDKFRIDILENESDQNSADDTSSENYFSTGVLNENSIIKHQKYLIDKCKTQLKKLGFMLENKTATRYASLSVKEFIKMLKSKEKENNCYWDLVDAFFIKFNEYLSSWLENLLIISSLELKSRINGVVDAARCQILYPNEMLQDISSDTYLQDIKKADNKIKEEFMEMQNELDKQVTKTVKDQLKKHENSIYKSLPDLCTEETSQIIHIIKPKLCESFEKILLASLDGYNLNEEITKILENLLKKLESVFIKIYKPNKMLTFFQYILNLFRTLKITMVYPLILHIPEEMIQGESKWYKELLKNAARKLLGTNVGPQGLVVELINDIKVNSIIKTTQLAIYNVFKQIQFFTKKYQETYKMARGWSYQVKTISPDVFKKLLLVDFVIKVIEKSFQKQKSQCILENLEKIPTFFDEFYKLENQMIKKINIQSFTTLSAANNIICFKRICRQNIYIMAHKSTKLLESGECLLYYPRMDYDILNAIETEIEWSLEDVIWIMKQLVCAVKCLLRYHRYIQINFSPENIMLKKGKSDLHDCVFFPFLMETSKLNTKNRPSKLFSNHLQGAVHQLGMVLSWIITNDIFICDMIFIDRNCSDSDFINHISNKTSKNLRQIKLIMLAVNWLLKPQDFPNADNLTKDLNGIKDN